MNYLISLRWEHAKLGDEPSKCYMGNITIGDVYYSQICDIWIGVIYNQLHLPPFETDTKEMVIKLMEDEIIRIYGLKKLCDI